MYTKEGDILLMHTQKRSYNKDSNFLLKMANSDAKDDSIKDILGKVRSEDAGARFNVLDSGISPRHPYIHDEDQVRTKFGSLTIAAGGRKGRNAARVINVRFRHLSEGTDTNEEDGKGGGDENDKKRNFPYQLQSKQPEWNTDLNQYTLDFGGRASRSSRKNFQLVQIQDEPREGKNNQQKVIQFGRVADDEFSLDFQWPLSPFLAFALALAACDSTVW
jgi:tubby-related protein 1